MTSSQPAPASAPADSTALVEQILADTAAISKRAASMNQERSPTSAPVNQDLRDKAMTGAAEDLDDNDTTEARDATGDPSDDDSDSTEAGEVRHRPCDNDSESDAEIRAHGPSHAIKQLLKQPLRRRKAKAATTNYRLKPHERRIRHYRSARQVAVEKHNAAVEKWTQQKAEWAKKAKNKGKPYHVPEPVLAPARKVNKNLAALREIRHYQKQTGLILPSAPFRRVANEVACDVAQDMGLRHTFRWQRSALDALQEATEAALIGFFENTVLACTHAKRVTIFQRDAQLVCAIMRNTGSHIFEPKDR